MGGTVFFDYDGTLHDSMHLYGPAFRRAYAALVTDGWAAPRTFSDEEIASWLGYSPAAMWASFMPELPEAIWQRASAAIGEEMRRLLAAGAGRLYPGAKAMLESLREEGCTLVFLSNCSGSYRDEHLAAFGLGGLFTGDTTFGVGTVAAVIVLGVLIYLIVRPYKESEEMEVKYTGK